MYISFPPIGRAIRDIFTFFKDITDDECQVMEISHNDLSLTLPSPELTSTSTA